MIATIICINSKRFYVSSHHASFWRLVESGHWENKTFRVFDEFLDERHSYIDLGAWIGPTVLYACQIARHCYAVEPNPIAFAELKENIALNPDLEKRIALCASCMGTVCGETKLMSRAGFHDSMSSTVFSASASPVTVPTVTFESFIESYEIEDCNFIKMDIEGGEHSVLPHMRDYLRCHCPTVFLSLHPHLFEASRDYAETMASELGIFRTIREPSGRVIALSSLRQMLLDGIKCEMLLTF